MFEARKRVFVELLGWDVPVLDGRYEIDQFDTEEAVYLIVTDGTGRHRASTRLLRTDGPHILGHLFPRLCNEDPPTGPKIREITRFCIDPELPRGERRSARNELVSAIAEYGIQERVSAYTAVASITWARQIQRFGWRCRTLGPERQIGDEVLTAINIDIDGDTIADLTHGGIYREACYRIVESTAEFAS